MVLIDVTNFICIKINMSNLFLWLAATSLFLGIWYSLLQSNVFLNTDDWHSWLVPVYTLIAFGIYSAAIVLYRVYTFNDCAEAAEELKVEIKKAREDLKRKGYKFET